MDKQQLRRTIASAKAGDAGGFETLLEVYGPRLYGYFLRSTGRHHDAEDLLSELTLRLVRRLADYDDSGRFEHWVFRIAANMARDRIRRIKAAPNTSSLSIENDSGRGLAQRLAADGPPADANLLAAETSRALQVALEKLEDTTREMVLLRYFGQMSFKELAEIFECPLGTVLARVHRGIRTLRRFMGVEDGAE